MSNSIQDLQKKISKAKYRLYIVLFVVLIIGFYPKFMDNYDFFNKSYTDYNATKLRVENIGAEVQEHKDFEMFLSGLDLQKENVYSCLNDKACLGIDSQIEENLDNIRTYWKLSNLEEEKMAFDHKKLLSNIFNFLAEKYGVDIESVQFGGVEKLKGANNLYFSTVDLSVSFKTYPLFLDFLYRLEKGIEQSDSVYFKVNSVDYKLEEYKEEQNARFSLETYFFKS